MRSLGVTLARGSDRQLAVGLLGLVLTFALELVAPAGWPRSTVAALGSLGFSLGAIARTAQAIHATRSGERIPWVLIEAGLIAWVAGLLARSAVLVAGGRPEIPSVADAATLLAAILFGAGFVSFLRGQRMALYALILDATAVTLVMVALITFAVQDVFLSEMDADPIATVTVLLYAILYAAATTAAMAALLAARVDAPRRAFVWLVVGLGLKTTAYTLLLPQYLQGTFASGTLIDPLWMSGMLAIGLAARSTIEDRGRQVLVGVSHTVRQIARAALPAGVAVVTAVLVVVSEEWKTEAIVIRAIALITLVLAIRSGLALYANVRLGESESRRAHQFEALYEVGLAAAGERSFEDLLKLVVEQATSLSRTDGAMVALAEPDHTFVIRALFKGGLPQLRDSVGEPLAGISLAALEARDLVVAERYADNPRSTPALHDVIKSAVAIPLVAHGEDIGTLAAYSAVPRQFTPDTRRLVRLYAAQAAIAIANAQLLAETHRLARDDDLTGVMNRRSLMERLEAELHAATRHGDILAVALCDVDGLKSVNDTAGHLAGNEVLVKVAHVLRESVRAEDVIARFGGDEFVLLFPRTGMLPAQAIVGRTGARLREESYHWAGTAHPVPRVSFGIAWFPEDGRTADALLAVADQRMYVDKAHAGRARDDAAGAT